MKYWNKFFESKTKEKVNNFEIDQLKDRETEKVSSTPSLKGADENVSAVHL